MYEETERGLEWPWREAYEVRTVRDPCRGAGEFIWSVYEDNLEEEAKTGMTPYGFGDSPSSLSSNLALSSSQIHCCTRDTIQLRLRQDLQE